MGKSYTKYANEPQCCAYCVSIESKLQFLRSFKDINAQRTNYLRTIILIRFIMLKKRCKRWLSSTHVVLQRLLNKNWHSIDSLVFTKITKSLRKKLESQYGYKIITIHLQVNHNATITSYNGVMFLTTFENIDPKKITSRQLNLKCKYTPKSH